MFVGIDTRNPAGMREATIKHLWYAYLAWTSPVLRQIAESGSFTAAATRLGYTQSAVSRQAAALERSAGTALFERRPDGVRLTPAGLTLLRHARTILDCLTAAEGDLTGTVPRTELVRLGLFLSAGAAILPLSLTHLAATDPQITVTTTEGTTTLGESRRPGDRLAPGR